MDDDSDRLSIRFLRAWTPHLGVSAFDLALFSCPKLGHTFKINVGEPFCNVCGAPNPDIKTPSAEQP